MAADADVVIRAASAQAGGEGLAAEPVTDPSFISIILTTYNRPDVLDVSLRALSRQSDRQFEIVVADDGSGPQTRRVIDRWRARAPVAIKHVWQEDRGFRGAEIRNRAIRASTGQYCIFLDGDCLARTDFVAVHRRLARPGWFVAGNRILLSPELTEAVMSGACPVEQWGFAKLVRQRLLGGVNRLLPVLRAPLGPLRELRRSSWKGAKTCNLAVARADLDRIDGFDCDYTGWGLEDSDLVIRLLHASVRRRDGRFATGVFHLWHPEADRSRLAENERLLGEVLASDRVRARKGLSSLRSEDILPAAAT